MNTTTSNSRPLPLTTRSNEGDTVTFDPSTGQMVGVVETMTDCIGLNACYAKVRVAQPDGSNRWYNVFISAH